MTPEKLEILEIIHNYVGAPPSASEIYDASNLITDKQKVCSHCHDLRRAGLIDAVPNETPNRYRITTAGVAALGGENTEMNTADAPEENGKPNQTTIKQQSNKRGLAAALDDLIDNRPPINYEPDELVLMSSTLRDVYDVLKVRLPDHEDLEDFRKTIDLIETLRQQMMEESA